MGGVDAVKYNVRQPTTVASEGSFHECENFVDDPRSQFSRQDKERRSHKRTITNPRAVGRRRYEDLDVAASSFYWAGVMRRVLRAWGVVARTANA